MYLLAIWWLYKVKAKHGPEPSTCQEVPTATWGRLARFLPGRDIGGLGLRRMLLGSVRRDPRTMPEFDQLVP